MTGRAEVFPNKEVPDLAPCSEAFTDTEAEDILPTELMVVGEDLFVLGSQTQVLGALR